MNTDEFERDLTSFLLESGFAEVGAQWNIFPVEGSYGKKGNFSQLAFQFLEMKCRTWIILSELVFRITPSSKKSEEWKLIEDQDGTYDISVYELRLTTDKPSGSLESPGLYGINWGRVIFSYKWQCHTPDKRPRLDEARFHLAGSDLSYPSTELTKPINEHSMNLFTKIFPAFY